MNHPEKNGYDGLLDPSNAVRMWMPVYINDWLGDTMDLTDTQNWLYFKSCMFYWKKGGPLTEDELKGICKNEFRRISRFFYLENHLFHHKRVDHELKVWLSIRAARVAAGRKGMAKRWGNHTKPESDLITKS